MPDVRWHQAPDGRRFRVARASACVCTGLGYCWRGWCGCGELLTAHDFTPEDAERCALAVLASDDARPGFGHPLSNCTASPVTETETTRDLIRERGQ